GTAACSDQRPNTDADALGAVAQPGIARCQVAAKDRRERDVFGVVRLCPPKTVRDPPRHSAQLAWRAGDDVKVHEPLQSLARRLRWAFPPPRRLMERGSGLRP